MSRSRFVHLLLVAFCLIMLPASAQVFYGTLVGTVEDSGGSVVPSAVVTVAEKSTGFNRQTVANDAGAYRFADLPPGLYELTVQAPGFSRLTQTDVRVSINNVTRADVRLQLGTVAESITVAAGAAQLQTDKADVHVDLGSKEVTSLPLPGYRNFQSLVNLVPGATPGRFQNTIFGSPGRSLSVNLNGANRNNNNTRLDGATNIRVGLPHQIRYVPPSESIEIVNISTNNFDAEQGFAGGAAIAISTKSGTNEFHGVMFEHHTNQHLYAKDFFYQDAKKPKAILNMFGGTLGGPIKKDRLFFFSSWERLRQRDNFSKLVTVSTAEQRAGNFSSFGVRLYDPLTGAANGTERTLFPDAIIPLSRQSAITRKMQSLIPAPTLLGLNANYFASAPVALDRDNFDGKINWNQSEKNTLWAKYSRMPARAAGQFSLGPAGGTGMTDGGGLGTSDFLAQFVTVGINHTFTPSFLVDGVLGFGRDSYGNTGPDFGTNYGLDVLSIPGTNGKDIRASGLPTFSIPGYEVLGGGVPWMPQFEDDSSLTYTTNFGWIKGKHDIRFGTDIARYWVSAWKPEQGGRGSRGQFGFDGGVTALNGGAAPNQFNSYAAFLLGLPQNLGKSIQFYEPMTTHQWMEGLYFRDRWQARRNLTITLGVRWEYYPLYSRPNTGLERYDPASNQVLIGGMADVPRNAGVTVSKKLFAPRVGLAYRLGQKGVIRAGYGISTDPTPLVRTMRGNYPAVVNQDYIGPNSFRPYGPIENGIPLFDGPDISKGRITLPLAATTLTLDQGQFRRGYIQSFNFVLERHLPGGFVGSSGYVGTRTVRQNVVWNINAAPPGGGANGRPLAALHGRTVDTSLYTNFPSAGYHSWQNQLDRRFSDGMMLKFAYTWSKAINWTSDSSGGLSFNTPSALWHNRALADFDRTHTLRVAWVSELPFGKGKRWGASNSAMQAVLGGWQANGIFSAYSGQPFTISASAASLNAPGNSQTADQVKSEVKKFGGIGRDVPFFDALAFRAVTEVRFGNTGRNILRGPGVVNVDASIFRNFKLTERWKLQFRAESFNFTNTPHFANPSGNVANMSLNPDGSIRSLGNFMAVTSTASGSTNAEGSARQFRFGLRVSF